MHRRAPLVLLLALAAVACDEGGPLPPTGDRSADGAALVFDGATYRTTGSRPLGSLSSSDMDELGGGETQDGMVDIFRLRGDGKEWEVLTRSGGRWLIWEPIALEEARRRLSQRLGVPEARVSVTEVVRVEWPNACLGAADGDEVCAEVITPGFRIVLEARGQEQVYHSDLQSNVRRGPE